MDVLDQPRAQIVERLLAADAEPDHRRPLADGGDGDGGERDQPASDHEVDPHVVVPDDAAVDRLLDQDRHDHPAAGADRRQHPRQRQPLAQDRRLLQPTADRGRRREAPDRLVERRHTHVGTDRSASNASTSSR